MDHTLLKADIDLSVAATDAGWTAVSWEMSDAAIADAFNQLDQPAAVPAKSVIKCLALVDRWGAISDAATFEADATKRRHARNFVDILKTFDDFDLTDAAVAAVVAARLAELIADGFIDAGDEQAILTMGDGKRTRGERLGFGTVTEGDVIAARAI